ncbi:apolipoprotein A-I [Centroberyx gerrardi]|uniref:apolipoprotein A-Ib n=1 Tax=Centroberyx gerrardi TaxID=166262 RepID=UPI003AAF64E4
MKFVALALALLLAVGSQAASLQADAPSQLDHIRSAVGLYLGQVKDSATKALDTLDDTEYKEYKAQLTESLDSLQTQVQSLHAMAVPYTDAFVGQIMESTTAIRTSIMTDLDSLRAEVEPKRAELKDVIEKHIAQYRAKLDPIITEYSTKHRAEMESLKAKLEPMVEELRAMVEANVEETKTALMPIVEAVRAKMTERLEGLKEMATPYVDEYKEHLNKAFAEVKEKAGTLNAEDLQGQVAPHIATLKEKISAIYETISASLNKN